MNFARYGLWSMLAGLALVAVLLSVLLGEFTHIFF
jgi:hypothetical protein